MLKQRVISAVVLALIVLGAIFHPDSLYLYLFFALVLFIGMMELVNLTVSRGKILQVALAAAMMALFWSTRSQFDSETISFHAYAGLALWLIILGALFVYRFSGQWAMSVRIAVFVLTAVLFWICLQSLIYVHGYPNAGPWMLIYILTLVWVADIGAYFAGRRFGAHKLAPGISPGKTWEGVVGGLLANFAWMSLIYFLSDGWGLNYLAFIVLGLATSIISVAGDLYESILKREAGLKDSGRILPGHGGVLDRVDSVIAAAPVYVSGLFLMDML